MIRIERIIFKLAVIHLLMVVVVQLFVLNSKPAPYLNRIHLYEGTAGQQPEEKLEAGGPVSR